MLFYSLTIERVQKFIASNEITSSEYATYMGEVVEGLIVKVGRQLPPNRSISGQTIHEWK